MIDDLFETDSRCPACGDVIDYCQGHGPIGDPAGAAILARHNDGDHRQCDPAGCDEARADRWRETMTPMKREVGR